MNIIQHMNTLESDHHKSNYYPSPYNQYVSKFGKLSSGHMTGRSVFIPIPKKGNAKECSNYCITVLISHASKLMLKILQANLQQCMTQNFQMYKLDLERAEETRDQIASIHWIIEKLREFQKKHLLLLH